MHSLNEDFESCTISDLEALFLLCDKLIDQKIESGNKGLILNKDKSNEKKMSYKKAKMILKELYNIEATDGKFSLGICDTCASFDCSRHAPGIFGDCKRTRIKVSKYDTCINHSVKGSGFGISRQK